MIKIFLNGKEINSFSIKTNNKIQEESAKSYLLKYIRILTGRSVSENSDNIIYFNCNSEIDDLTQVALNNNNLVFSGGMRGVIYSVFSFLEKLGCRFYTPTLEVLPQEDIYLKNFILEENSPFVFRDVLDNHVVDIEWCLKNKINSDLWHTRVMSEKDGYGYNFAGTPAHTLTGEFLLKPYIESNPEFFSLKDGKRITDMHGQVCMTNEDAVNAVTNEVFKIIEQNPMCNVVSVSPGDNDNYCECEKCKQAVKEKGLTNTYFSFINKVAKKVKARYPKILVHTFAYEMLDDFRDGFELEDNIMLQFCLARNCKLHKLNDKGCKMNQFTLGNLKKCTSTCKNVFIWEYINCFKYQLFPFPPITHYLEDIQLFRILKVKGLFYEGAHRDCDEVGFVGNRELKCYILSKLMWNPNLTVKEYNKMIADFCKAFYGQGYVYVLEYFKAITMFTRNHHVTYNCFGENKTVSRIIDEDKTEEFVKYSIDCLNRAMSMAKGEQITRIQDLKIEVMFYNSFWRMESILKQGTKEEKEEILKDNKFLIDYIIKHRLPITFYGKFVDDQNKDLAELYDVPANKWNYNW